MNTDEEWVPLNDHMVSALYIKYRVWIADLTEIRARMEKLRDETRIGWSPFEQIQQALDDLNERDELYAAKHMDTARAFLDAAEAEAAASRPHRLARIERCKERIAALERAHKAGWRPTRGLTWPHPAVLAWCGMFSGMRFHFLDDLESVIARFETLLPARPKLTLGPRLLGRKGKRN
jgi:hypothetical protein